jgi:hypothetical protein
LRTVEEKVEGEGRKVLARFQSIYRYNRTGDSKTKRQEEEKEKKDYYSGKKKKRHIVKTQYVVNKGG